MLGLSPCATKVCVSTSDTFFTITFLIVLVNNLNPNPDYSVFLFIFVGIKLFYFFEQKSLLFPPKREGSWSSKRSLND